MGALLRRLELGLAFLGVVAVGISLAHALPQAAPYEVKVPVEDAAGLSPGSDLMIAGARAGGVESIVPAGGVAFVTVKVDPEHAPLRRDATISVRPKSLLGERYLALDPGQAADTLPSGASLPSTSVTGSTSLEDVTNTFDQPTREKLQTLIVELGSGVAGRGQELNQGLAAGHDDLASLRGIASTLASRDRELRQVIVNLDGVTQELARTDRRQQLGALIQNLEALMHNLAARRRSCNRPCPRPTQRSPERPMVWTAPPAIWPASPTSSRQPCTWPISSWPTSGRTLTSCCPGWVSSTRPPAKAPQSSEASMPTATRPASR